jgi:hypothetical protein
MTEYKTIKNSFDAIKLNKAIKSLTYQFEGQHYHPQALHQAKKRFYLFNQGKEMPTAKFLISFRILVSAIEECGGEIGHDPGAINKAMEGRDVDPAQATTDETTLARKTANERHLAVAMLSTCDNSRYGKLTKDLENDFTKGTNLYPKTITEAYNLIVNYWQSKPSVRIFNDSEGITFTTIDTKPYTKSERDTTKVKCFNCNKKGTTPTSALTRTPTRPQISPPRMDPPLR